MSAALEAPVIPPRLRRPLVAAWISLGLHAALIALVQVAPPPMMSLGAPVIEVRLVPAQAAPSVAEPLPAPTATEAPPAPALGRRPDAHPPRRVPAETAAALPAAASPEPPVLAPESAAEPEAAAGTRPEAAAELQPPPAAGAGPAQAAAITSAVDLTYYGVRDLDVQPHPLREIVPDYPADADRQRLSGRVRLQLKLEADGRISDIDVVSAVPPGVFDESAIKAFRDARFAPAQKNGRPVRARVVIEVLYDWEGRARPH